MSKLQVLHSTRDASVNFIEEQLVGFLEARYVRRCTDYFVCYLSSHTGCNRGCAFCHLTATRQTSFKPTSINDYVAQALQVFKHYRLQSPAKYMHYAFMARGEPLANPLLLERGDDLLIRLGQLARDEGLPAKFAISTIMPQTLHKPLVDIFWFTSPTIYYSMYSADETWRARWMPTAMPVERALSMLAAWQRHSKKIVKLHWALIAGENDSEEQAEAICDVVAQHNLLCEFNLVRYNPASIEQGSESDEDTINAYVSMLRERLSGAVKIVSRIGHDVKASCGMFVNKEGDA